jgi:hypothetical protein
LTRGLERAWEQKIKEGIKEGSKTVRDISKTPRLFERQSLKNGRGLHLNNPVINRINAKKSDELSGT